ncbi:MAG: N-6 DNA methylase [Candidatus Hydrogenedentes bacterium]|nr:N-6 DNA methylase [Candidatus Hydrogenedentota bacterium]
MFVVLDKGQEWTEWTAQAQWTNAVHRRAQHGPLIDRVHRELTPEDIQKIAGTYHAWRDDVGAPPRGRPPDRAGTGACPYEYEDVAGFCKSATLDDIRRHNHILTPGRYVGAAEVEDDGELFEDKMQRLTAELRKQIAQAQKLDQIIWANLEDIGYGE